MITLDQLRNSVDLYRGEVAFTVPVASLPGAGGPAVELTLGYRSDVAATVATWNRTAATGIVGLGWSLPIERIVVDHQGSAAGADDAYYLVMEGGIERLVQTGTAADGALLYALLGYRFWQIRRYPAEEKWKITREDGTVSVYGDQDSERATVDVGVAWGNWLGTSRQTTGQQPLPVGWRLSTITDLWGSTVTFTYTQVTARVGGTAGHAYTQATYLSKITGVAGDTAELIYGDKAAFEYQDPHTDPPPPNAWQDRFETRFLSAITINNPGGSERYTVNFDYTDGHGHTEFVGTGQMAKRLLMGITVQPPGVPALPGLAFTYVTTPTSDALGALRRCTTPEGGVATYEYADVPVTVGRSRRDTAIAQPNKSGQPRFWFEERYVVAAWLDSDNNTARIVAYSWEGQWLAATLDQLPVTDQAAYAALAVATAPETFGVVAGDKLALYQRDVRALGRWVSPSSPLTLDLSAGEPTTIVSGEGFVAVLGQTSGKLNPFHWDGTDWVTDTVVQLAGTSAGLQSAAAARDNVLFAVSAGGNDPSDPLHLLLMYRDALGRWQRVNHARTRPMSTITDLALQVVATLAAVTAEGPAGPDLQYVYDAVAWPADYGTLTVTRLTALDVASAADAPTLILRGAFAGIGPELFRFDGVTWTRQNSSAITYPGEEAVTGISYGYDKILRTIEKTDGSLLYDLVGYNPAAAAGTPAWTVPANMRGLVPTGSGAVTARAALTRRTESLYVLYPVQDGTSWTNGLFFQQPDGSWHEVLKIPDSLTAPELLALQVVGEQYCICQTGTDTVVYPLMNGGVAGAGKVTVTGHQVLVPDGTGTELLGQTAFVSYAGTWDGAGFALTLQRVITEAVTGRQTHTPAVTVQLDSGYQDLDTAYHGAAETATMMATGWRAAYNKVTTAAGTNDVASAPNGSTEDYFFNHLGPGQAPALAYPTGNDTNAADAIPLLAGLPYASRQLGATADGAPEVGRHTWFWWVFPQYLSAIPGDRRRGFYTRTRRIDRVLDGSTTTVGTRYSLNAEPPVTGLPVEVTSEQFNALGSKETLTQQPTYFWEKYDPTRSLNLLLPIVETRWATDRKATAFSITTWRDDWNGASGRWAADASYAATRAAPATFNQWTSDTAPLAAGWLKISQVTARNAQGQPQRTTDAIARSQGTIHDQTGRHPVATFFNADLALGEADYYGFETYESGSDWRWAGGGSIRDHIVTAQSHTGARSLRLDPVAGSKVGPVATFLRTTGSRSYLFSCWIQTPTGFSGVSGDAEWQLSVYTVGAIPQPVGAAITLAFPETDGKWQYLHQVVDLAAIRKADPQLPAGTPLSITVLGYNQKSGRTCWLDELRFSPLEATYAAAVYDPETWLPVARLGENGATLRLVRDSYRRTIAVVGPDENVNGLTIPTLSRSLSADGAFDPNLPNSVLRVTGAADGVYYDFDPSDEADWELPNNHWSVTDRRLRFTGTSTAPLGSQAMLKDFSHRNYSARVRVQDLTGAQEPPPNVSMGTGNVFVYWDQAAGTWTLATRTDTLTTIATRTGSFGQDWCFTLVDELVMFYVNGLEIFSHRLPSSVPHDGKLTLGLTGKGAFSELVVCVGPRPTIAFLDGAGNPMQTLALLDGETVVAGGTLYDLLQRPRYGKNPVSIELDIRQPAVTSGAEQNRIMANIGTYLPSSDGRQLTLQEYLAPDNGYPFTQTRYETSPLSRVVESGQPGTAFAIGGGHTRRIVYGHNTADGPMTALLPAGAAGRAAGSYYVRTVTDPNGVQRYELINQTGQLLAERVQTGPTPTYQTSLFLYDKAGNLETVRLPNYYDPPLSSQAGDWVIRRSFTFLGQLASETTPDTGQTRYAYDSAGRLRFVLDADGAAQVPQRIKYLKYDGLDRVTEEGTLQNAQVTWAQIQPRADQEDWPDESVSPSWYRRYAHDYTGAATDNLVGRLWQVAIDNNGADAPDTESYTYDRRGNVLSVQAAVAAYDDQQYLSSYAYNNSSQLIQLTYPRPLDGGRPAETPFQVTCFYNRLGQLAGVGLPPKGTEVLDPDHPGTGPEIHYAAYTYDPMGNLSTARLNDNAGGHPISRSYAYNLAGWPTAQDGDFYTQALTYDQGGFGDARYYNGQIASGSSVYRCAAGTDPWTAPTIRDNHWAYQYDPLGRLEVAASSLQEVNTALGLGGSDQPVVYDANGNLLTVPRGSATEIYGYLTGTSPDQVQQNNRVQEVNSTVDAAIRFEAGQTYPGWTWGASNAGPSDTRIVPVTAAEDTPPGQALQVAGGSLGHYEYLRFQGFPAMGPRYLLSYWLKTPASFAAQEGPAGWSLRFFTEAGQIVDTPVVDFGQGTTTWQRFTAPLIDTRTLASTMGLDEQVITVALVLINGRLSGDSTPGASLLVADVSFTGYGIQGQYGYQDANGSITSASGRHLTTISYHPLTGLTTILKVGGARSQRVDYVYGPGTRRSAETRLFSDGGQDKTLTLYGANGRPIARKTTADGEESTTFYLYGVDGLLATVPGNAVEQTRYVLKDHLGSTRAVVNQDANLVQTYDYGPFGELLLGPTGDALPYRYTGQPEDAATGLYNYSARLYDPVLRRFYGADPAGQYPSPYVYVGDNPISVTDPSGMMSVALEKLINEKWSDKFWDDFFIVDSLFGDDRINKHELIQEYYTDVLPGQIWKKMYNQTGVIAAFGRAGNNRLKNFTESFLVHPGGRRDKKILYYPEFAGSAGYYFDPWEFRSHFLQFITAAMHVSDEIYFNLEGLFKDVVVDMAFSHPDIVLNFFDSSRGFDPDRLNATAVDFIRQRFPSLANNLYTPTFWFFFGGAVDRNSTLYALYTPGHSAWELATIVSNSTFSAKTTFFNQTRNYTYSEYKNLVNEPVPVARDLRKYEL